MRTENGWVIDDKQNRASIATWGSEEEAAKILKTLDNCSRCSDCSDCSPQKIDTAIPVIADIHKLVYEAASQPGAFDMGDVHACETTHCRAGWVVHLAGKEGYDLEKKTSWLFAAQQIYKASGYDISPTRFYDSNEKALADMKRLAEVQS